MVNTLIPHENAGLSASHVAHYGHDRPLCSNWITDELIAQTCQVWSHALGRNVTPDEAIEMLQNLRRVVLILEERELST